MYRSLRSAGAPAAALMAIMLLIAGLSLLPAGPFSPGAAEAATTGQLNQKLDVTQSQLKKIRDQISKSEAKRKAALGDIAALDQTIDMSEKEVRIATAALNSASDKLGDLRSKLAAVTKDLKRKQGELNQAQTDLVTQQKVLDERLVNMYKSGGRLAYVTALLEPGSLTDLVNRIDMLKAIVDEDNDILNQIKDLKAEISLQTSDLEQQRARVSSVEKQQTAVTKDLHAKADDRQSALDDLESAKAAKQEVVNTAEKNEAAWNKQEDELLAESNRIKDLLQKASSGSPQAGKGVLYRPVPGGIGSPYGYRIHPISHVRKLHTGADMHAGMGTPIRAAAAGRVIYAGWRGGYGKCTIIDHGNGLATLYGHQSELLVSVGQRVGRGQVIGKVGSTGYSTGPHLHFEVRVNGTPVNPAGYL